MAIPSGTPPGPLLETDGRTAPPPPTFNTFISREAAEQYFDGHAQGGLYVPGVGCLVSREGHDFTRTDGRVFLLQEDLWFSFDGQQFAQMGADVTVPNCAPPAQQPTATNGEATGVPPWGLVLLALAVIWWLNQE